MDLHREKESNCKQVDFHTCTCRGVVNAQAGSCQEFAPVLYKACAILYLQFCADEQTITVTFAGAR